MATLIAYSESADGYVQSVDSTYATANAGSALSVTASDMAVGQQVGYILQEGFISFDISTVDGPRTAKLTLVVGFDFSTQDFTLEARSYDWGSTLDTGDWRSGSQLSALPLVAHLATAGLTTNVPLDLVDDDLLTYISGSSLRLVLASSRTTSSTVPTTTERIGIYPSEAAGTTNDPMLTVTHGPVTAGPVDYSRFPKPKLRRALA